MAAAVVGWYWAQWFRAPCLISTHLESLDIFRSRILEGHDIHEYDGKVCQVVTCLSYLLALLGRVCRLY